MEGALTGLRRHATRVVALKAIRDLDPQASPEEEARFALPLAHEAGFAAALPLLAGETRRDAADTALAVLARDRDIHYRLLMQSAVAVLFVSGLVYAGSPVTHMCAALALLISTPTWALAIGVPRALLEVLIAAPVAGRPAFDMLHARGLTALALFLGAGADPALCRRIADDHVGIPLPERVVKEALAPGSPAGKQVVLREESERPLLRAAAWRVRASQFRLRLLLMALTTIALATAFYPGVRDLIDRLPAGNREPVRDATFRESAP